MAQGKGSAAQVLIDFETVYGEDPDSPAAIAMPINPPFDLKATRPLKKGDTLQSNPNPAMPFYGNRDVKGSITVPVDLIGTGYWLRAMLGAPSTDWPAAQNLDNAAADDKGGGLVGIPITAHPFVTDEPVTIDGTDNYDGNYVIVSETENEIVITATYQEETFTGAETCRTNLRTHVFQPSLALPSLVLEPGWTDIDQYFKFNGVKVGKYALDFGGDNELVAKLDLMGANETPSGSAYAADPTTFAFTRFHNRQLSFEEGGEALATIKSGSLVIARALDGDSIVANGDTRFDLPEQDYEISGAFKLFFADRTLYDLAAAGTERSFELLLTNGVYSLSFLFPEILYTIETPTIVKGGAYVDFSFQAYYEDAVEAAALVVTLINNYAAYT